MKQKFNTNELSTYASALSGFQSDSKVCELKYASKLAQYNRKKAFLKLIPLISMVFLFLSSTLAGDCTAIKYYITR